MLGKNFIYNGVAIPYTAAQGRSAGWYADVLWTTPAVRNVQLSRQDFHGAISRPTFADGRLIQIRGEIFDTSKTDRGTIRNTIANLFLIQSFPSSSNELKKLEFTDDDGTEWFIWAKVYSMPEYEHERGDVLIGFFVQLYAPSPLVLSKDLQSETGIYGLWGGIELPVELPAALDLAVNSFSCVNSGNFAAPAIITVEGEITNPKIFNLTTGKYFEFTVTMEAGDVLIIDTEANTAELNGSNILASRAAGSNWLFVNSGTNIFVLTGDNFDIDDQEKATIEVEWYNTKLV